MNNPFDYIPDRTARDAFLSLLGKIRELSGSENPRDITFCRELEEGKMLGVLVGVDAEGKTHTLYAFSGQLGTSGFHYPGFVGPAFDYLDPEGYFKRGERRISEMNEEIARYEANAYAGIRERYQSLKEREAKEVGAARERYRLSKAGRDARRAAGATDEELALMVRQSQYEKAELRRLKNRLAEELSPLEAEFKEAGRRLEEMRSKRREASEALQRWLFDNFRLRNAKGESRSLGEIFADTPLRIPPSGAGECCGPKLLQEAYRRGLTPLSMAEYWYGHPKGGELRVRGRHYPACRGKCLPILGWMLHGLEIDPPLDRDGDASLSFREPEIIHENEWFCVVDKPSGMLTVPGKGRAVSLQQWLIERYAGREAMPVHRLDRDTSGLVVVAFGVRAYKKLQELFARRRIHKRYIADLEGDWRARGLPRVGEISLPLSPDWLDRPRQRVDREGGKEALTQYEFGEVKEGRSRIIFHPLTGRTHQLRVHAASPEGLGMPIAGDPLYGEAAERLHLHAARIEFDFPLDGRHYEFDSPLPFT